MTNKDYMSAAHELIKIGWTQNRYCGYQDAKGNPVYGGALGTEGVHSCYCASGAINEATELVDLAKGTRGVLRDELHRALWVRGIYPVFPDADFRPATYTRWSFHDRIINWNDDIKRTKKEVLDAFERTLAAM